MPSIIFSHSSTERGLEICLLFALTPEEFQEKKNLSNLKEFRDLVLLIC